MLFRSLIKQSAPPQPNVPQASPYLTREDVIVIRGYNSDLRFDEFDIFFQRLKTRED